MQYGTVAQGLWLLPHYRKSTSVVRYYDPFLSFSDTGSTSMDRPARSKDGSLLQPSRLRAERPGQCIFYLANCVSSPANNFLSVRPRSGSGSGLGTLAAPILVSCPDVHALPAKDPALPAVFRREGVNVWARDYSDPGARARFCLILLSVKKIYFF